MTTARPSGRQTIPAGEGRTAAVAAGDAIRVINTYGHQVADTWALNTQDSDEFLSMAQTRRMLLKLWPEEGDLLWSNRRTPMLCLERDSAPGHHDTLFDACDEWVYRSYGCPPGHRSCKGNFVALIDEIGVKLPLVPHPLNLWMNVPVHEDMSLDLLAPTSRPGDEVVLRALMDVTVLISACPMDVTPVNGEARRPADLHYEILGATDQAAGA